MEQFEQIDDQTLVEAFLAQPPRRELLPPLGNRGVDLALSRRRKALYRALSVTDNEMLQELLFGALTEPIRLSRGSMETVHPFSAVPEAGRMVRHLVSEGAGLEEIREKLLGLQELWSALQHTAPDSWRVLDVASELCVWHLNGRQLTEIHRGIEAAEALWASDPSVTGIERRGYFRHFLRGLAEMF